MPLPPPCLAAAVLWVKIFSYCTMNAVTEGVFTVPDMYANRNNGAMCIFYFAHVVRSFVPQDSNMGCIKIPSIHLLLHHKYRICN